MKANRLKLTHYPRAAAAASSTCPEPIGIGLGKYLCYREECLVTGCAPFALPAARNTSAPGLRSQQVLALSRGADPVAYCSAVLFPLKAKIDLSLLSNGSWLLTSAGSSAASWWYSNCPNIKADCNQHAEAPASWHIADLPKLLAAI